jgi:hypothetical protein
MGVWRGKLENRVIFARRLDDGNLVEFDSVFFVRLL